MTAPTFTEQQLADLMCPELVTDFGQRTLINGDSIGVTLPWLTKFANFVAGVAPAYIPDGCRGVSCDIGKQTVTLRFETFHQALRHYGKVSFLSPSGSDAGASTALPTTQAAPTEAQVAHAARALADRHALACNINKEDNWKLYGEEFTADARFVMDAVQGAA